LDHTRFRKYDSTLGRWLTPDPKVGSATNPQSWNRYTYVLNRPLTLTDPQGLDSMNNSECSEDPVTEQMVCVTVGWAFNGGHFAPVLSGEYGGGAAAKTPQSVNVKGSLTSKLGPQLAAAIKNLSPNCQKFFNSLTGGLSALSGCVSSLQFFNASSPTGEGDWAASSVLTGAPNESLYNWIQSQSATAAVLSNSSGISNGVVIGPQFSALTSTLEAATLVHEASHFAYQMNDAQMAAAVQAFSPNFNPANYGYPTASGPSMTYTTFLAAGCPQ